MPSDAVAVSLLTMEKPSETPVKDIIEPVRPASSDSVGPGETEKVSRPQEVFQQTEDGVDFRTVSWQRATIIFLKINFAMSILTVPGNLGTLGAVGGSLSIVGWEALNTCELSVNKPIFSFGMVLMRLLVRHCRAYRRLS
jgi:hypothetical protein